MPLWVQADLYLAPESRGFCQKPRCCKREMKLAWITGAVQGGVSFLFSGYGGDLDGFEVMGPLDVGVVGGVGVLLPAWPAAGLRATPRCLLSMLAW